EERDADELEHAGRAAGPQVLSHPPLRPGAEVVDEADRGDRRHARLEDGDDPADQREAQAPVVRRVWAEGEQDVPQLPRAVDEPAEIASRRAVAQRELDLLDAQPGAQRVESHPRLAAESGGGREAGSAGAGREHALAGEWLTELAPRPKPHERGGR